MPATSKAALDRKRLRNNKRNAARKQSYQDSKEKHLHIELDRQFSIDKQQKDLSHFDSIEHPAIGEPHSSSQSRSNLTVVDRNTEEIILQKIRPTSYDKKLEAEASSELGSFLYHRYLAAKKSTKQASIQTDCSILDKLKIKLTRRKVVEHHLGIWHTQGKLNIDFTKESCHPRYKQEALDLLLWARLHTDLVMKTAKQLIDPAFKTNIKARSKGRAWLRSFIDKFSIEYLHPWWTTVAFFSGFAGGRHVDEQDCIPSFLFNFGEAAWIELPEYSVRVLVEPLDLVVLNS